MFLGSSPNVIEHTSLLIPCDMVAEWEDIERRRVNVTSSSSCLHALRSDSSRVKEASRSKTYGIELPSPCSRSMLSGLTCLPQSTYRTLICIHEFTRPVPDLACPAGTETTSKLQFRKPSIADSFRAQELLSCFVFQEECRSDNPSYKGLIHITCTKPKL